MTLLLIEDDLAEGGLAEDGLTEGAALRLPGDALEEGEALEETRRSGERRAKRAASSREEDDGKKQRNIAVHVSRYRGGLLSSAPDRLIETELKLGVFELNIRHSYHEISNLPPARGVVELACLRGG